MTAPRDDLYRAIPGGAVSDGKTLTIRLAPHDTWAEIQSQSEGHFLERFARSAYRKTMAEHMPKMMFQHGQDPEIGEKLIASTDEVGEDDVSPFARGRLFDGVSPLVRAGLEAGAYGASHRFSVVREEWDDKPTRSAYNPDALPERTITEARLFELGPVTWPAYASASAALRSMTDEMRGITAPSADAEPEEAHLEPERRDEPIADTIEENPVADQYTSIDEKRAREEELNDDLKRLHGLHPGRMPEEDQARFDSETFERDELRKDIAAHEAREQIVADAVTREGNTVVPFVPKAVNQIRVKSQAELHSPESRAATYDGRQAEYRDDAKRILETTKFNPGLADQARSEDKLSYMLDLEAKQGTEPGHTLAERIKYTGSPEYVRTFEKIIKAGGQLYGLTPEEQRGTALAVGVDGTGGFTVPFAFDPTVIAIGVNNGAVNPYRRSCRVVSISGTDTWNALTATAVVATRTTEAAPAVEQGPTFAQPQYIVTRVQGQITASFEMFQDRTDLASELGSLIQEAKDNEEETSMATGASAAANIGVGPVSGTSGAYTAVAGAGSGVLAAGDFLATEAALPVRHRFNAQWFGNRVNIRKAQALETTGGQLFGGSQYPSVGNVAVTGDGNTGLRLLGYPVNESPSLPTATTTTITALTLANVSSYVIVDRIGMSVQFIPFIFNSSALATGQQALYFLYRNTAKPINVDAGRTLRFL